MRWVSVRCLRRVQGTAMNTAAAVPVDRLRIHRAAPAAGAAPCPVAGGSLLPRTALREARVRVLEAERSGVHKEPAPRTGLLARFEDKRPDRPALTCTALGAPAAPASRRHE